MGIFITFEGPEGAGKSTLIRKLRESLQEKGKKILQTREPGGTEIGEMIRSILLDTKNKISPFAELALYLASRAQHISEIIRPALNKDMIVLCDRFNDSTYAYQAIARGLGLEKVESICSFICEGLEPDLTFYLDLDPETGFQRVQSRKKDRMESEGLSFHQKVRDAFLQISKRDSQRFKVIDATKSAEEVFEQVCEMISESFMH